MGKGARYTQAAGSKGIHTNIQLQFNTGEAYKHHFQKDWSTSGAYNSLYVIYNIFVGTFCPWRVSYN